jgi:hypothetical protein
VVYIISLPVGDVLQKVGCVDLLVVRQFTLVDFNKKGHDVLSAAYVG